MKTEERIRQALEERAVSIDPKHPYNQGFADALAWVLEDGA